MANNRAHHIHSYSESRILIHIRRLKRNFQGSYKLLRQDFMNWVLHFEEWKLLHGGNLSSGKTGSIHQIYTWWRKINFVLPVDQPRQHEPFPGGAFLSNIPFINRQLHDQSQKKTLIVSLVGNV